MLHCAMRFVAPKVRATVIGCDYCARDGLANAFMRVITHGNYSENRHFQ
ncbi:hypothetical protein [Sphingobium yanoikuyae]|jgi:hypothetical protein|nr:hypothetical protein [Sphingobium yanoikuyae]